SPFTSPADFEVPQICDLWGRKPAAPAAANGAESAARTRGAAGISQIARKLAGFPSDGAN
ncbi:MAG TPA: hypothetical protein PKL95_07445, partial [Solirubrobacterales bacterium]|nr:hypothetical protein [Solirubrobacterales bacterium]HNK66752.1 hypothetical protein [Solirubrobacterales bacterium]HNL63224.1 hypothetical protein [Solirubrobacterales bacterium]HNN19754.1 hypothetical protein [Solirubrobacterales bacterium]HNO97215.1 hypothetical protein [Solirubrobacterales bacterium]